MRIWLATSEVGNKSHKIEQNMCEENKGALTMKLDVIDMNRKRLRINAVDKHCELHKKSIELGCSHLPLMQGFSVICKRKGS